MNDIKSYKKTINVIIKNSLAKKDTLSIIKAYKYLAEDYADKFIADSAYMYNYKVEKLYRVLGDNMKISETLLNKAIIQHNESDFLGCEKSVLESLKFLKKTNNNEMLYQAYNLLGIIYAELNEYSLSHTNYTLALNILDKLNISPENHLRATTLNNIGILYRKNNDNIDAIKYFQMGLAEKNLYEEKPIIFAMLTDNLTFTKFKIGDYKNAKENLFLSLKIREDNKIIPGIITNKIHLSEYYSFLKDTLKARQFAKEAYQTAKINKEKRDLLLALQQLSKVNSSKALEYSTEYYKVNDSLELNARKLINKFARIEFETDEIIIQKNQLVEQRKTIIYISLGIILLGVFIFIIRLQATKNRELKFVQEQQKANEEIYQLMLNQQNKIEEVRQLEKKRIAQELHDGVLGKLFGTRMNLGILNNKDGEMAKSERIVFIDELQNLEQEIREISHDLNSEKTAVFNNFVVMVGNFIASQRTVCKATIAFSADEAIEWNTVDNMAKINFYRIMQEAFQNINKHANAQNVTVAFVKTTTQIKLDIQDDGVGFNYAKKKKGIGLLNMNSRITDSGGNMQVVTAPGEGTLLQFDIPLHDNVIVENQ
ncbi:MAG: tetratricopeptide repeat protein [Flavobacterium sp.]|nr:tetratricopeptide repeat protein [Flavobacterium sp.]